jgi:hypothetical protein
MMAGSVLLKHSLLPYMSLVSPKGKGREEKYKKKKEVLQ